MSDRHTTEAGALAAHAANVAYATNEPAAADYPHPRLLQNAIDTHKALRDLYALPHVLIKARDGFEVMPAGFAAMFRTYKVIRPV